MDKIAIKSMMVKIEHVFRTKPLHSSAPHTHKCWEIIYFDAGEQRLWIEDEEYPVVEGSFFCIPPEFRHKHVLGANNATSTIGVRFLYNPDKKMDKIAVEDKAHRPVLNLLRLIYSEYYFSNDMFFLERLLESLVHYVFNWRESENRVVEKVNNIIVENISNSDFNLETAVGPLDISFFSLLREFKKIKGLSPYQYLLSLRLENACKLLENNSYSVRYVARMSGFNDPYYFSRFFKKRMGTGPREYRKTLAYRKGET